LGSKSIFKLKSFLDGYYFALLSNGIDCDNDFWDGFQLFISNKFNIETSQNWAQILFFFSNDEAEAFDRFFDLLEAFYMDLKS